MHAFPTSRAAGMAAALVLSLGAAGCSETAPHETTPTRPVIRSFTAAPGTINAGAAAVLSWNVTGATSYAVAPGVGAVVGTSVAVSPTVTTTYTLSATNAGGTSTSTVTVNVNGGVAPPAGLSYAQPSATYTVGVAITPNSPTSTGGAIASYAVSPALPGGLALNSTTGVISGTPTAAAATASYVVTGTNSAGSTTASVSITVNAPGLPTIVSFGATPATIAAGESSVLAWDVLGATQLSIDQGIGTVTGTSRSVTPATTTVYTLSATNAAGTVTATATVTVGAGAPTNLAYTSATYAVGVAIPPNAPTSQGGAILSYTVSPALPAGLAIDATTGVISGTPTTPTAQATYVVTGTNLSGSATANVAITVVAAPAPGFPVIRRFSASPGTILDGSATTLSWDVADATTLSIDPSIGTVTGTEIQFSPTTTTTFTLTATNATGSTTATATVTVNYLPPTNLTYSTNPASYVVGTAIAPNNPTTGGGVVFSYAVTPALPPGLALDTSNGVITGTPTAVAAQATYRVRATNPGGFTEVGLVITVALPPIGITTQPADVSVVPPSTASFTVVATGLPPLTYQWTRVGTGPIAGATAATYTTPATSAPADEGATFRVVVTDAAARTVTSADAVVSLRGFFATGPMAQARTGHTATLLADGKVLVVGGNSGTASLASAELYDPATGTFSATTGAMATARQGHSAVLLPDGNVLVAGGCTAGASGCTTYLDTAEIYDAVAGTFRTLASRMSEPRTDFAAVRTGTTVLLAGGFWLQTTPVNIEHFLASTDRFDPATELFTAGVPMGSARRYPMSASLQNGTVLLAGGSGGGGSLDTAEAYDPNTPAFVRVGSMSTRRQLGTATVLSSGKVLVAGGVNLGALASAELYDPATSSFTSTGSMSIATYLQTATLLASGGKVLVAGGTGGSAGQADLFDPVTGVFTPAPPMSGPRSGATATPVTLTGGVPAILVAGGTGASAPVATAELWRPAP